jgi:glycosyltransferase involved in cell wall biosynthesis
MKYFIFLSSSNPFRSNGASSNRVRGLIEGIVSHGGIIHLYILSPFFSKNEKENFKNINQNLPKGLKIIQLSSFVFESRILQILYHYLLVNFFQSFFKIKMEKVLASHNGVVFSGPDYYVMNMISKIKDSNPNLSLICEISEYLDYYKSQTIPKRVLLKLKRTESFFNNNYLNKLQGCVLMTKTLYKNFEDLKLNDLRLLHLPMTVDVSRFVNVKQSPLKFKKPYILFVGVMNNEKDGVDILINSFNEISLKYPEHYLYLVGPWQYDTPGHLNTIKSLGLSNRVFWINEINRDEIPPILLESSLLVLPRPDSKQAQGGFPTKLGEYLASGNPICATKVGEIPDYLIDNESVFFAEPGSIPSFADAMDRSLSDKIRAQNVGLNGKKIAEKFFNKEIHSMALFNFFNQF